MPAPDRVSVVTVAPRVNHRRWRTLSADLFTNSLDLVYLDVKTNAERPYLANGGGPTCMTPQACSRARTAKMSRTGMSNTTTNGRHTQSRGGDR